MSEVKKNKMSQPLKYWNQEGNRILLEKLKNNHLLFLKLRVINKEQK